MSDERTVRIRAHRQNLDRYCRLLTTNPSDTERKLLHGRIAQERLDLERLEAEADSNTAMAFIAAQAFSKKGRSGA
jgi:hypothetical protein